MSKKDAYIEKAQASIKEQLAKLEQLKARAQGEIADQKLKSHEKINEVEEKIRAAKAHLTEITDAADDSWENIKGRFDELTNDIGMSFKTFFGKEEKEGQSKDLGGKE